MKVTDHISKAKGTLISFEILPPLKGRGIEAIYNHLDPLMEYKPAFINVTYHRSEHIFKKKADGSFETEIFIPREGLSTITVEARNRQGRAAVVQRTVTVKF